MLSVGKTVRSLGFVRSSLLVLAFVATTVAVYRSPAILSSQWEGTSGFRFLGFLAVLFVIATFLRCVSPSKQRYMALLGPAAFVMVVAGLGSVATIAYLGLACLALGLLATGQYTASLGKGMAAVATAISVGLAIVVGCVGILSHFYVNHFPVYVILLAVPIVFGWRLVREHLLSFRDWLSSQTKIPAQEYWMAVLLIVILVSHIPQTILPERYHDALAMHLLIPTQVSANGIWHYDFKQFVWAVMPMGVDWLYTVAYLLGDEVSAKLTNLGVFLLVVLLLQSRMHKEVGPHSYLLTAWFASVPLAFIESATLFVENGLMLFLFAAFLLVADLRQALTGRRLLALAVLAGAALQTKLHAVFGLAPIGVLVVWRMWRQNWLAGEQGWVTLAAFAFLVIGLQPYVVAYYKTGNPVFPFFNAIFESPYFDQSQNFEDARYVGKLSWSFLYDITVQSQKFFEGNPGVVGLGFGLLIPVLIGQTVLRRNELARFSMAVWAVYSIGILLSTQYIRYLYPAFPFIVLTGLVMFERPQESSYLPRSLTLVLLGVVASNLYLIPSAGWILPRFPIPEIFDKQARDEAARRDVPLRDLVELANNLSGGRANFGILAEPVGAGLDGRVYYANWYNDAFRRDLLDARDTVQIEKALSTRNIDFLLIESGWLNEHRLLEEFIQKRTLRIKRLRTSELRKVADDVLYGDNLLVNGDFQKGRAQWRATGNIIEERRKIALSAGATIEQELREIGGIGDHFLYTVEYDCLQTSGYFVAQVGWLDKNGKWLSANGDVFGCSPSEKQTAVLKVKRPIGADRAIVYSIAGPQNATRIHYLSFQGIKRATGEKLVDVHS